MKRSFFSRLKDNLLAAIICSAGCGISITIGVALGASLLFEENLTYFEMAEIFGGSTFFWFIPLLIVLAIWNK